ncbi:MAG: pilus assembly protein PilO [Methylophilales bacterium RIFCSPHIGHO2_02_FULL_57_10]|nr:MAG: pilus assembly protein PilO [Methylophilales bacterium RIFCSPHIGHO2_02_FULL_57_10]
MKLSDLQDIDFKNVGGLPLPVKAVLLLAILLAVIAAGGWFVWKPMLDELQKAQIEEWGPDKNSGLRGEYESKLAQAANLDNYKAQLKEAELKSNILLQQLPDKSQMEGLLTDINQAGIGRGLEFELFKPGTEKPSALYAEMPISIRVLGNYHDLGAFAADVAKMSRIVTLSELSIVNVNVNIKDSKGAIQGKLAMDAVAKTYRALDKGEMAPPKKKGAPPKRGGK